MRTSPLPDAKSCSASRPDLSWSLTGLVMSSRRYARPFCGSSPPPLFAPYAARMFHFAAPDVNGFGVRTLTPGLSRSCHVWMLFGAALRTLPLADVGRAARLGDAAVGAGVRRGLVPEAGVDEPVHVGSERERDDVG